MTTKTPPTTPDREIRAFAPVEFRESEDGKATVRGYAAVFDQETNIGDWFVEKVSRGAFTETLKVRGVKGAASDVVFLVDHGGQPIARTRSGTLTLREDDHGLLIETELNLKDPDHVRLHEKLKRGDLDKMSFAFRATEQKWSERGADELPLRTVIAVELYDVTVVTDPAYDGTEVGLRSLKAFRGAPSVEFETRNRAAMARMRMRHAQIERGAI